MLASLNKLPPGIDGWDARGKVSKGDHERLLSLWTNAEQQKGRRFRLMYRLGPDFQGFTLGGALEVMRLGVRFGSKLEGCAVVSDRSWLRESLRFFGYFLPCPVRIFANDQGEGATDWLRSLPPGSTVSHRILRDEGVVIIEVKQALHSFDFDPVVAAINSSLRAGRALNGLVIHSADYHGWDNLAAFFRHLRFTKDYDRSLARVALAGDSGVTSLAPQLAAHFVGAQVKTFTYDSLNDAVAWARGAESSDPKSASKSQMLAESMGDESGP